MLDPRDIADDPEAARHNLRRRRAGDDAFAAIDRILELQARRGELVLEGDQLRAERNAISDQIGELYKQRRAPEAEAAKARVAEIKVRVEVLDVELGQLQIDLNALAMDLPNVLDPSVPDGASDEDNPVVASWGTPPTFDFTPQAHVEIGERLGILDLERSAKLAGARFSVLYGLGARLERALISFFLDLHTSEHGYREVMVPYMAHRRILEGTGQLPKFEAEMFKLTEKVNGSDTFLIPTAEVPVTNLHREEILEEEQLPLKYVCFTPCFRAEAGSAGRDVRGLMRVHQFHKVELVWTCTPETSAAAHEALTGHAEEALRRLELPYRKVLLCAGDTSFGAARCYDLEVWLPSQQRYREVSSCSNFGDFQARRMALRYRPTVEGGKKAKPRLAHTLNGSGLAVGRTLLAVLENHQQADGSVRIPEVLRPYMGVDRIEVPPAP
jgi:seryl-tRNA synthetase